ncbi:MAG: hypothetical protein D3916_13255, partial [Candidatus Electrothrix sp. MAN1_4]|nr:hypothetical protein [Candidatus Electrothrix sp. MAN1_4]
MSSFVQQIQQIREYQQVFLDPLDYSSFSSSAIEQILAYGAPVGSHIEHHTRLGRCMNRLQDLIQEAEQQGQVLNAGTVVLA